MSEHRVTVRWEKGTEEFDYDSYHRDHDWEFENGVTLKASSTPDFLGNVECVDPEEAFLASLSSCHMLTFLAICAKKCLIVTHYEDSAVGYLEKNEHGKMAVTRAMLQPVIVFEGEHPDAGALQTLHRKAHENCFIANSVTTRVTVQ